MSEAWGPPYVQARLLVLLESSVWLAVIILRLEAWMSALGCTRAGGVAAFVAGDVSAGDCGSSLVA